MPFAYTAPPDKPSASCEKTHHVQQPSHGHPPGARPALFYLDTAHLGPWGIVLQQIARVTPCPGHLSLAKAGGVTVSHFEWVRDFSSFFWSEDQINARRVRILQDAFEGIWKVADEHRVNLRTATFIIACKRMLQARELRGLCP